MCVERRLCYRYFFIIFLHVSFVTKILLYPASIQRRLQSFRTGHFSNLSNTSITVLKHTTVKSNINIWDFPECSLNLIMFLEVRHLLGANSFAHDPRISIIFSTKHGGYADWILIQPFSGKSSATKMIWISLMFCSSDLLRYHLIRFIGQVLLDDNYRPQSTE